MLTALPACAEMTVMIARHIAFQHDTAVNFKDYILGRRVTLTSPLAPKTVESAIRNGTKSVFNPFYTGVVGWCRFGRISLRWATAMWSNGFQPTFAGKIQTDSRGSRLTARFGAPISLLVFFAFWYFGLANVVVISFIGYVINPDSRPSDLIMLPAAFGFMFVPLAFHLIFNRGADEHFERIVALLGEIAELEPVDLSTKA